MDLRPYGIEASLATQSDLEHLTLANLSEVHYTREGFVFPSGNYTITEKLGKGQYGSAYGVVHETTRAQFAIKVQMYKDEKDIRNILNEAIMNILASYYNPDFVMNFYEIGVDLMNKKILMRVERLEGTIQDLLYSKTPEENDTLIPNILTQLATILAFYQKTLKMNHRDLLTDNIMYITKYGQIQVKLIDFGLSCMKYKNIYIETTHGGFKRRCNRKSRDLSFFINLLVLDYRAVMTTELYNQLRERITFERKHQWLHLNEVAPDKHWNRSYNVLNRINIPSAYPHIIQQTMNKYTRKRTQKTVKKSERTRQSRGNKYNVFKGFLYS